jgi:phosphatidylinositol alpha-1,6-mannosyltransferase
MTGAGAVPGGIASHNQNILPALVRVAQERGLELTVLSFLENDEDRLACLPATAKFRGFAGNKARLALALVARAFARPLFVFDHVTLAQPLMPLMVVGAVRAVIFAHGSESWKRIRSSSRWLFSRATLVLTNSEFTLRKMRERIRRFNGAAAPLGLSPKFALNKASPARGAAAPALINATGETRQVGARVCLLVGRLHPGEREKGHYELLEVWPQILQEFPEVQLVFAGPGEDRPNLEQAARDRGVGSAVFVPGAVAQEALQQLYEICYAFTMPSRQEGFGLVYLEAMNAAKPCLGCRDGGAEEVIVDGETGLLIGNPIVKEELLAALRTLLRDRVAATEMGKRGFERLHANFTADHVQKRVYDQISRII